MKKKKNKKLRDLSTVQYAFAIRNPRRIKRQKSKNYVTLRALKQPEGGKKIKGLFGRKQGRDRS